MRTTSMPSKDEPLFRPMTLTIFSTHPLGQDYAQENGNRNCFDFTNYFAIFSICQVA
jgi:hypothetical protein